VKTSLSVLSIAITSLLAAPRGWALAPTLYGSAAHQSPVRGDPDDLLLLPGDGFAGSETVVYAAITDTAKPLVHPPALPTSTTATLGIADVVGVAGAPYSLTIHLPEAMKAGQSYGLWVVNTHGEWSNGIQINDARPLWITPDETFASATAPAVPRVLKVVGRNLQPAFGMSTQVRLVGPHATFRLPAEIDAKPNAAIDRYVARVQLPANMPTGSYDVQVSRDGVSWVSLIGEHPPSKQTLSVLADPKAVAQFPVGRYTFGACIPNANNCAAVIENCLPDPGDQKDQTLCVAAAIAAAHAAGGGAVVFGPGTWFMNSVGTWAPGQNFSNKGVSRDGLWVPEGVSLQGAGRAATTLLRGAAWDMHLPTFALQGHNAVSGFTFRDAHTYTSKDSGTGLLMLGVRSDRASAFYPAAPAEVSHVVITENVFDKPFYAITNGGLSIDHLSVTNNEFGAFRTALFWGAVPSNVAYRYRFSDSIVASNRFFPGSYVDTSIGQGSIASELSGGYRTDFSNNVADGTSTAYLYNPQTDAKGFRAAYFWSMHDNLEMLLVSQNSATCTGDKGGDGEAIAYDNNHNRPGFLALAVPVLAATSSDSADTSAITVQSSLIEDQFSYGSAINISPVANYYMGDWLQVVQGPGIGQARKISAISAQAKGGTLNVTFTVAPKFDVLPRTGSLVGDGRLVWQTYTVDNQIDHRVPLCLKSNPKRHAGGLITLYAATTDSVVEGNTQYDTSGILVAHTFKLTDEKAGIPHPGMLAQSFNEIRGNLISGTYDHNDKAPSAEYGIAVGLGATPDTAPPPTLSYGLAISHNVVSGVGGSKGAISLFPSWFTGPQSHIFRGVTPWKISDATLIFKNTLSDIGQPGVTPVGVGVSVGYPAAPVEWRSVLYGNTCTGALAGPKGIVDLGTATVRVCPSSRAESCECNRQPADLGISGTSTDSVGAAAGHATTYSLNIVNNGPGPATDAALSVELPAGLSIDSIVGRDVTCDTEDFNVNLCHLGTIGAGAHVALTVGVTVKAVGTTRAIFSVTHREADTNAKNDSVAITTGGH
jgi:Domain of unknown function DUF11